MPFSREVTGICTGRHIRHSSSVSDCVAQKRQKKQQKSIGSKARGLGSRQLLLQSKLQNKDSKFDIEADAKAKVARKARSVDALGPSTALYAAIRTSKARSLFRAFARKTKGAEFYTPKFFLVSLTFLLHCQLRQTRHYRAMANMLLIYSHIPEAVSYLFCVIFRLLNLQQ